MASSGRTVVSLPTLTNAWHQAKSTEQTACVDAYQSLPDPTPVMLKHMVHLDWSTNHYHVSDLGLTHDCTAFTNDYHRGDGQGIDLGE